MNLKEIDTIYNSEKVKFYYKDRHINLGEYEHISMEVINKLLNDEEKLNTLIYIGNESMLIISIINIAILTYLQNITNKVNNIMKHIDIGDKVFINGKIGEYKEYCDLGSHGKGIKVFFQDGDTSIILDDYLYKVIPYNGDANINKMTSRISTKKFITKDIIANILNDNKIGRAHV